MVELKELLGQWKDLPQLMGMEDTLAPRLDKEGNRESAHCLALIPSRASQDTEKLGRRSPDNVQTATHPFMVDGRRIAEIPPSCTRSSSRL